MHQPRIILAHNIHCAKHLDPKFDQRIHITDSGSAGFYIDHVYDRGGLRTQKRKPDGLVIEPDNISLADEIARFLGGVD